MSPRNEAPAPSLRRLYIFRRILFLLLLFAFAGLGVTFWLYGIPAVSSPPEGPTQAAPLEVVKWTAEGGQVTVATFIPMGTTGEDVVQGILGIYEWSQRYHLPVRCGFAAVESCALSSTTIVFLDASEGLLVSGGTGQFYVTTAQMQLDQFLIHQILTNPPETIDDLILWHTLAQEAGAGAFQELRGDPFLEFSSVKPVEEPTEEASQSS